MEFGSGLEGSGHVETFLPAVGPGQLTVHEYRAARVLATRSVRVRWNDPVREGFEGAALGGGEIQPGTGRCGNRGVARIGDPGQVARNRLRATHRRSDQHHRTAGGQYFPSAELPWAARVFIHGTSSTPLTGALSQARDQLAVSWTMVSVDTRLSGAQVATNVQSTRHEAFDAMRLSGSPHGR